jgi:hypothetical protein
MKFTNTFFDRQRLQDEEDGAVVFSDVAVNYRKLTPRL